MKIVFDQDRPIVEAAEIAMLAAREGVNPIAELEAVTDAAEVRKLVGQLDILVANAGIAVPATIEAQTIEDFDRMFAVNVRAPFFLVQQLLPMLGDGSSIVMTSSLAARAAVGLPSTVSTKPPLSMIWPTTAAHRVRRSTSGHSTSRNSSSA